MTTMTTDHATSFAERMNLIPEDGMTAVRQAAMEAYQSILWPSMRDESWRYTDTRAIAATDFKGADPALTLEADALSPFLLDSEMPLMVFADGIYQPKLSSAASMPGVQIHRLSEVMADTPERLKNRLAAHADFKDDPACALSTVMLTDGVMVEIEAGAKMDVPLHIIFFNQGAATPISTHPRVLIVAHDGSTGTVIESHVGTSDHAILSTPVTEMIAGDEVHLDHYRMVREGSATWHLGDVALHQGAKTEVSSCVLAFDGPLIRTRMRATLDGEDGNAILHGLAMGHGARHIENLLRVNHMVPHCRSRESFKHILEDKSTAAFTGRIYVAEGAQKTDAVQTNRNLLLSNTSNLFQRPWQPLKTA